MNCKEARTLLLMFLDGETLSPEYAGVQEHLAECDGCRAESDRISSFQGRLRRSLQTTASQASPSPQAWDLLRVRLDVAERAPARSPTWFQGLFCRGGEARSQVRKTRVSVDLMNNKCQNLDGGPRGDRGRWTMSFSARMPRWLPASLAVVALLVGAFAMIPPLRTAAQDPFGIFRVQRFTTVTVDPAKLPSASPDPTGFGSLTVSQMPKTVTVSSVQEAQSMVDFAIRAPKSLPAGMGAPSKVGVMQEGRFSYTFDLQKARDYLASMGIALTNMPAGLDGATVKVTIPSQVMVEYQAAGGVGPSLVVSQGHSPVIETPPGLDVDAVRSQLLGLPGLPPELVSQLQSINDWQRTAIIPLPKEGVTSKETAVDGGMKGLLLQEKDGSSQAVLWEKNGVVYGMFGAVTADQLLAAANSMAP